MGTRKKRQAPRRTPTRATPAAMILKAWKHVQARKARGTREEAGTTEGADTKERKIPAA